MNQPVATHPPALIYRASLHPNGVVKRVGVPLDLEKAISIRKSGGDVVVWGPKLADNMRLAMQIEAAATGNRFIRHSPHEEHAGPNALSHFQPEPRPPAGHTFYEDPPWRTAR